MNAENIIKAIKMGVCYVKPWPPEGTIRCYDDRAGYGKYVDLSQEEYDVYCKVTHITVDEQIERLNKYLRSVESEENQYEA